MVSQAEVACFQANGNVVVLAEVRVSAREMAGRLSLKDVPPGTSLEATKDNPISVLEVPLSPIVPPVQSGNVDKKGRKSPGPEDRQISPAHLADFIRGKSARFLKANFPKAHAEHSTLVRKSSRRNNLTCEMAPEFRKFADFLTHMGPAPSASHSLDRTDYLNPTYGPGLCSWASPTQQANNRRTNVRITFQKETRTLAQWAEVTGIAYETLKKRHQRLRAGDPVDGIFHGARSSQPKELRERPPASPEMVATPRMLEGHAYVPGMDIAPVPESAANGWPIGSKDHWEADYQDALRARVRKYGGRGSFTRAYLAVWVYGSIIFHAERAIRADYGFVFWREGIPQDRLSGLYEKARCSDVVLSYFSTLPCYQWAIRELEVEQPSECAPGKLSAVWKTRPCHHPRDAKRYFALDGDNDAFGRTQQAKADFQPAKPAWQRGDPVPGQWIDKGPPQPRNIAKIPPAPPVRPFIPRTEAEMEEHRQMLARFDEADAKRAWREREREITCRMMDP